MRTTFTRTLSILAVMVLVVFTAFAESKRNCQPAGGMLMTNLGAVDANTTLGYATGDLKGAVGATILNTEVQNNGATLVFTVQHHWVTESGDTLSFREAKATVNQVAPDSPLYGVSSYAVHLSGGTGKFAGATGKFNVIGEADLSTGQIVLRYTGRVCFAGAD